MWLSFSIPSLSHISLLFFINSLLFYPPYTTSPITSISSSFPSLSLSSLSYPIYSIQMCLSFFLFLVCFSSVFHPSLFYSFHTASASLANQWTFLLFVFSLVFFPVLHNKVLISSSFPFFSPSSLFYPIYNTNTNPTGALF